MNEKQNKLHDRFFFGILFLIAITIWFVCRLLATLGTIWESFIVIIGVPIVLSIWIISGFGFVMTFSKKYNPKGIYVI